jgi:hypothetical protein
VSTEDLREVLHRYFDSIIHFYRSTPGCWNRKTGEEKDVGKITNILSTGMIAVKNKVV